MFKYYAFSTLRPEDNLEVEPCIDLYLGEVLLVSVDFFVRSSNT